MSAGTNAAPLLVPSADVTAKNLRASVQSRSASATYNYDSDGRLQRRAVSILDRLTSTGRSASESDVPKFTRFVDENPGLLVRARSLIKRLRARRSAEPKKVSASMNKPLRTLARACELLNYSPLPPIVFFLGTVCITVIFNILRPTAIHRRFPAITPLLDGLLVLTALLSILWKREGMLHALSRGEHPYRHPVDSCLEPYAEYIAGRAAEVKAGREELKQNHAQLDALRRELAKDPAAADPNAVLKPNKHAAAMIKAGALGAGYDAEKAAEAERLRKEESLRRSHQHWRERSGSASMDDALEKLQSHAATGYRKHTKELKMRAAPRPMPQLAALRRAANAATTVNSLAAGMAGGMLGRGASVESALREASGSSGASGAPGDSGSRGGGRRESVTPNESSFSFSRAATGQEGMGVRRYSAASEQSIRTAASAPASVVRQSSKRSKLRLFRKRRTERPNPEDVPVPPPGEPLETGEGSNGLLQRRLPSFPRMSGRRRRSRSGTNTPMRANTMEPSLPAVRE